MSSSSYPAAPLIRTVSGRRDRKRFAGFPWSVYKDDPLWVPPFFPDRMKAINPQKGVFFKRGEAEFFMAFRSGRLCGTICAAEDKKTNADRGKRECIFGFFECVDDLSIARALFDAASAWARKRGLQRLVGPYNLDYEDAYGILIRGRDRPPVIFCGHSPTYYRRLAEEYGFVPERPANLAFAFEFDSEHPELARLDRLAALARKRGGISVRGARFDRLDEEIDNILHLLNATLGPNPDSIPWYREPLKEMLEPLVRIADPELILFAERGDKVIGWFPGIPNFNEVLSRIDGLRSPVDYLKLPFAGRTKPRCLSVKSVLVLPQYQKSGAGALLFFEMYRRAKEKGYRWIDLSLTSEDNPETPVLAGRFGAYEYKRYQVYKKDV